MTDEVKVHHLVACDLAAGSPDLGAPALRGVHALKARDLVVGNGGHAAAHVVAHLVAPRPSKPARRPRKPSIGKMIMQMEKAGKPVRSVTTSDGTTFTFGQPEPTEASNPWLADLDKVTRQ